MATKAKKKPTTDQIATAQNDITRNYIGKTLLNPDAVLSKESGGKGVQIYEEMLFEARVFSEMQKRKLAVIGKEWEVTAGGDSPQDQKIADFVAEVLKKFSYDTARQSLLSGIVTGFKPGEIMWNYSEGDIWIEKINAVSPRRFSFDLNNKLRLLTWGNMLEGEEIPDRKFIVFTNPSDTNSPYGDGIGRALYWPLWFKKNGVKFWAVFLDKFGQPTPWGKYPAGTEKGKQDDLLDALKAMQTDQCIITPDNMSVELLEAARASSVDSYDRWEKFWNDAISFIILGQTATTEGTPGQLGAATERDQVRLEIVKADADLLCECQNNTLIPWLVDYNFPGVTEYPKVWIRTDPEEDLKPLAERDRIIVKEIGLPTAKSYFYDTYGIPEPQPDEELVSVPQTPSPFAPAGFSERNDRRWTIDDRRKKKIRPSSLIPHPSSFAPVGFSERNDRRWMIDDRRKKKMRPSSLIPHPSSFAEPNDWITEYMRRLEPARAKVRGSALAEIEAWLAKQGSPPSEEEFTSALQGILGSSYKSIDLTAIHDTITAMYQDFKSAAAAGLGGDLMATIGFGGADVRAINFLGNLDHYYISKFVKNTDAQAAVREFLKTRYLEGGEGLFGRGDPKVLMELKNILSQHMIDLEGYQVRRIIETDVVRAQNWAHISQMHDAGISEIEIIEPTMECAFCAQMNGKIIQVDTGYSRMIDQSNMTPEEYEAELQANAPSLDSIQDFVDQGLLPPYHPHCRGTIVMKQ
jgi:phage gp29-like protein